MESLFNSLFLKIWEDFEMRHGNVDTYKEYMRIKRSVTNKFDLNPSNIDNLIQKVEEEPIEELEIDAAQE